MKTVLTIAKIGILIIASIIIFISCSRTDQRQRVKSKKTVNTSHVVIVQQMKFSPAEVFASRGDTITWINKDIVDHNVTEEKSKEWSSSVLSPGKSWSLIVAESADYLCTIHPVMKGKLIVK